MKHYATLLDLEFANDHPLKEEEFVFPHLQGNLLHRMLWGYGETEEESMLDAMKNLEKQGAIETIECLNGAHTIVKNNDGRDALLHLWLYQGDYLDEPKLFPVPGHDALIEFCDRYKLPDQAKKELAGYFTVFLKKDNQPQPVLQEDSMTKDTRNSHGLYDAPVRSFGKEHITLTEADIERQRDAGAFLLSREEAIEAGFINPQDEADADTVIVTIRMENV